MAGSGQIRPSSSIAVYGSLSPDSCRARRMLLTAESGHKRSFTHRNRGTPGAIWHYRNLSDRCGHPSVAAASLAVATIDADRHRPIVTRRTMRQWSP